MSPPLDWPVGMLVEASPWVMIDVRVIQPTVGSAIPVQVVLGALGKQHEWPLRGKAISSVLVWFLLQFLSPSSLLDVSSWWIVSVRWSKPSSFHVTFGRGLYPSNRKQSKPSMNLHAKYKCANDFLTSPENGGVFYLCCERAHHQTRVKHPFYNHGQVSVRQEGLFLSWS